MKKLILITILVSFMATPVFASLQDVLDSITVSPVAGSSSADVITDAISDTDDSYWGLSPSGGCVVTIIVEIGASNYIFGVYDMTNPDLKVPLLTGSNVAGDQAGLSIKADGSVYIFSVDTGVDFAGNAFGYYLASPEEIFYSDTRLNGDKFDHMLAVEGVAIDYIQVPTFFPALWNFHNFVLGWDALSGGSPGENHDDFVIMIESVMSVPSDCCFGCRFTGGGVDTDGNWDHTLESGEMIRNGAGNLPAGTDRAQFGGQAGANTGQQPQPKGEWTHHQQLGPSGSFTFHGGTASAPAGTEIDDIRCSDPGGCKPSGDPPSPVKQLDFDGIGTFKSIGKGSNAPTFEIPNANVTAEGHGNKTFDGTFHWFEVNIDDLGEPGGLNSGAPNSDECPGIGFGEKGTAKPANCDCPDFYRITIYDGVDATDVVWVNGSIDPTILRYRPVIYEFYGYIDGGNLQIHHPTGYDL